MWRDTCLNWDTQAIRGGILEPERQLTVLRAETAPGIDSKAWDDAPEEVLRKRGGMPFANMRTTMKALRDSDALYVRVTCLYPSKHPEDIWPKKPDGDIFKNEYVELGISPPNDEGHSLVVGGRLARSCRWRARRALSADTKVVSLGVGLRQVADHPARRQSVG